MHKEVISTLLGYTSIASWLCAQIPQILFTWRRKSVEGFALSLFANWLLADITNLIGCVLTDQLPFQTFLATYSVLIDVCFVWQFLHYATPRHKTSVSIVTPLSAHQSRPFPPPESHKFRRLQPFRSHSVSCSFVPVAAVTDFTLTSSYKHESSMCLEMDQDVHGSRRHRRSRGSRRANSLFGLPESVVTEAWENHWRARRYTSLERDDAGDGPSDTESEAMSTVSRDAFHSDSGRRGRGRSKHVSCSTGKESPERHNNDYRSRGESHEVGTSNRTTPLTTRGRQLRRPDAYNPAVAVKERATPEAYPPRPRQMSAASTTSASASSRRAGMAFLGVFVLFGFSSSHLGIPSSVAGSEGRVLSIMPRSMPSISLPSAHSTSLPVPTASDLAVHLAGDVASLVSPSEKAQRIIGCVSAWTWATLSITSRFPQIWKNFVRKSVEGLSMHLFIFAFLGNFFYAMSILASPKMDSGPQARQYILDSVPYLLGSGGTLIFDVIIFLQSLVYDPRRTLMPSSRTRRRNFLEGGASEEERRTLLGADSYV